jgi:hypothetical protein
VEGLDSVISKNLFEIFFPDEIQLLISGSQGEDLDIDDLKRHTIYHGFKGERDPYIIEFWRIV